MNIIWYLILILKLIFGIDQFPSGGQIEDILDNAGQKIQDAYGNYLSQVKDAGGNYQLAITKVKGGGGTNLISRLDKYTNLKKEVDGLGDLKQNFLDDFANISDDVLREMNDQIDLVDSWKSLSDLGVDVTIRRNIDALADLDAVEDALQAVQKIKPTWPEIQALFKRGNDFNKKGRVKYIFNEIVLQGVNGKVGKRLDSYLPEKEIISRKATTLSDVQASTFEGYLRELITKYKKGSPINSSKLPPNTILNGDYFLEIPTSNKTFFESSAEYQKILSDFNTSNNVDIKIKYLDE